MNKLYILTWKRSAINLSAKRINAGLFQCTKTVVITCRRGSTPVSTVLRKSVRFFIINIFLIIIVEISKSKSGKWSVQMFSLSSFRALDRNRGKGTSGS